MGVGKTEIGKKLAEELKMNFVDTDDLIEKREKKKISEIFDDKGEGYFRNLETEVLKGLLDYDNYVISTGGGIVLRKENVEILKSLGKIILLKADPDIIYERVKNLKTRPLLNVSNPKQKILEILNFRNPIYESVCDFYVDTGKLSIEEAVKQIILFVRGEQWRRSELN